MLINVSADGKCSQLNPLPGQQYCQFKISNLAQFKLCFMYQEENSLRWISLRETSYSLCGVHMFFSAFPGFLTLIWVVTACTMFLVIYDGCRRVKAGYFRSTELFVIKVSHMSPESVGQTTSDIIL